MAEEASKKLSLPKDFLWGYATARYGNSFPSIDYPGQF